MKRKVILMTEDKERLHCHIDADLKKLLRADDGSMTDLVEEALRMKYASASDANIGQVLKAKEAELASMRDTHKQHRRRMEELEAEIEQLRSIQRQSGPDKDELREDLDRVLDKMDENGTHVYAGAYIIGEIADEHFNQRPDGEQVVMERLRDRVSERPELSIREEQWNEPSSNQTGSTRYR